DEGAEQNQDEGLGQVDGDTAPDDEHDEGRVVHPPNVTLGPAANARVASPEDIGDGPRQEIHDPELSAVENPEAGQQREILQYDPGGGLAAAEGSGDACALSDGHRDPAHL